MKGVTFGFCAPNGYFASAQAHAEVEKMAALGTHWVCVVPTVYAETFASTRQFRDFEHTPDDGELRAIIDLIHARGMRVKLRPMLEDFQGNGRNQVTFPPDRERIPGRISDNWARWFASMRARAVHYARIAQETGCELYGLDSELDKTIAQDAGWQSVLRAVRETYRGPVDACFTRGANLLEHLRNRSSWLHELDTLSYSAYLQTAEKPGASVDQMAAFLAVARDQQREIAAAFGKPYYFGECGCNSATGAAASPSSWSAKSGYDGAEQANFLQAIIEVFGAEPWWRGLFWWKWDEQLDRPHYRDDPRGDKGFTIHGKPAAEVFRRWCAQV